MLTDAFAFTQGVRLPQKPRGMESKPLEPTGTERSGHMDRTVLAGYAIGRRREDTKAGGDYCQFVCQQSDRYYVSDVLRPLHQRTILL